MKPRSRWPSSALSRKNLDSTASAGCSKFRRQPDFRRLVAPGGAHVKRPHFAGSRPHRVLADPFEGIAVEIPAACDRDVGDTPRIRDCPELVGEAQHVLRAGFERKLAPLAAPVQRELHLLPVEGRVRSVAPGLLEREPARPETARIKASGTGLGDGERLEQTCGTRSFHDDAQPVAPLVATPGLTCFSDLDAAKYKGERDAGLARQSRLAGKPLVRQAFRGIRNGRLPSF
jgi:hypothetical protein